jgi:hypothetical protein
MAKKYYALNSVEDNVLVKIFQIILGIACIAIAIYWFVFNSKSMKINGTLWITIIFLIGFGLYQIWAGFGKTIQFIEINSDKIRLKKSTLFPAIYIQASEIQKIELYPLNLIFILKTQKKMLLRFGATFYETNEKIKDELLLFADSNAVDIEIMEEKL